MSDLLEFNLKVNSLLYTISGLPVHALVVHFAVVLLPLAAFSVIIAIYIPRFRKNFAFASVFGTFVGTGAAFVAKQSGEALSAHIGLPKTHANYGNLLPYISTIFFALSLVWYQGVRNKSTIKANKLGHSTALLAVIVIGLTFLTGHSGAQAVWKARIEALNSTASTDTSSQTIGNATTYSRAEVAKHSKPSDCWTVINNKVYNLTKWIDRHPGGPGVIELICGKDGTGAFNGQHGGQARPASELANFAIGKLG